MDRVILQIPLSKTLKEQAESVSTDYGFSSLQEIIRVILAKLAKKELRVSFTESGVVKLSPQGEKRYKQMDEDFRTGKNVYTSKNVKDLMKQLSSD